MVDPERVRARLAELGVRLAALERTRALGERAFLDDADVQAQVERHLQVALQAAIDVALHTASTEVDRRVSGYGDAFTALQEVGWLSTELATRMRAATGLRNLLVHGYSDVDPRQVWRSLANLNDLRTFAQEIQQRL